MQLSPRFFDYAYFYPHMKRIVFQVLYFMDDQITALPTALPDPRQPLILKIGHQLCSRFGFPLSGGWGFLQRRGHRYKFRQYNFLTAKSLVTLL
jgi:hypothetical protein